MATTNLWSRLFDFPGLVTSPGHWVDGARLLHAIQMVGYLRKLSSSALIWRGSAVSIALSSC